MRHHNSDCGLLAIEGTEELCQVVASAVVIKDTYGALRWVVLDARNEVSTYADRWTAVEAMRQAWPSAVVWAVRPASDERKR